MRKLAFIPFLLVFSFGWADQTAEISRIQDRLKLIEGLLRSRKVPWLNETQLKARKTNLDVLHEHWLAKRFPMNVGHPGYRVPYFIDDSGTACAVGYLIIRSGRSDIAAHIRATQNNLYLENIRAEGLSDWVKQSGLELEELKLIQPEYGFTESQRDPLLVAVRGGNIDLLRELLSKPLSEWAGISPQGRLDAGLSYALLPWDLFIENGGRLPPSYDPSAMVLLLLQKGADPHQRVGQASLLFSTRNEKCRRILRNRGARFTPYEEFVIAVGEGDMAKINQLMRKGIDPNHRPKGTGEILSLITVPEMNVPSRKKPPTDDEKFSMVRFLLESADKPIRLKEMSGDEKQELVDNIVRVNLIEDRPQKKELRMMNILDLLLTHDPRIGKEMQRHARDRFSEPVLEHLKQLGITKFNNDKNNQPYM